MTPGNKKNKSVKNIDESRLDHANIATIALDFINHTHRNIFLTGGAGTGKTTFLKFLKGHTHKKMVVAAPTGVAAINAGGTTIHRLFDIPPRSLDEAAIKNIRLNGQAKSLLREIELLIIDEASMLRADVLDAMDYLLQEVRQEASPMGGLQVVFIGDLFQLPPIENQPDAEKFQGVYQSLYFTDSKVFTSLNMLMLELTKVHRQSDPNFINLLSSVRKGTLSNDELNRLNALYRPDWIEKDTIILTTHNRYASQLNEEQMSNLQGVAHSFMAEINGEFSEDRFPVDSLLQLKLGCRVMIIKNDNSANRQYFNGKTGVVANISDQIIDVKFDDNSNVSLERETWSNIAYTINGENDSLNEEILGTFRQFPLKLAWAITIHKSQGLTFENAVIDVAEAFAPGQVYVALSRIKSLEGVFLKSKIPLSAIIQPPLMEKIFQMEPDMLKLTMILRDDKKLYIKDLLLKTFNWQQLKSHIDLSISSEPIYKSLKASIENLGKYASSFSREISERILISGDSDWQALANRINLAEIYFSNAIKTTCIGPLREFIKKNKDDFKFRGEVNEMKNHIRLFQAKTQSITLVKHVMKGVVDGIPYLPLGMDKLFSKKVLVSKIKKDPIQNSTFVSTEEQSLKLFQMGKSIREIALARSLGIPAIEYHLATYIPTEEIKLSDIIPQEILNDILPLVKEMEAPSIAQLRPITGDKLSMGQLQALSLHLKKLNN